MKRLLNISNEELQYSTNSLKYMLTNGRGVPKQKILVNGSPKTGTTWMLKLINSIPGYREVGNFDGDLSKYQNVVPGDVVHAHAVGRLGPRLCGDPAEPLVRGLQRQAGWYS